MGDCGTGSPKHERLSGLTVVGTRSVKLERPSGEHHLQGADGGTHVSDGCDGTAVNQAWLTQLASAHRQPPEIDAGVATPQSGARQFRIPNQIWKDSVGRQSFRRQAVVTLLPERLVDPQAGAAFRADWDEST